MEQIHLEIEKNETKENESIEENLSKNNGEAELVTLDSQLPNQFPEESSEEEQEKEHYQPSKQNGRRLMVLIDHQKSTDKAFRIAFKEKKPEDELYFLNVYSSWDYLNEEKNSGKLSLAEYQGYCDSSGIPTSVIQVETNDPRKEVLRQMELRKIDIFYASRDTLAYSTPDTNLIFSVFGSIRKTFLGTPVSYVEKYADKNRFKLVIV